MSALENARGFLDACDSAQGWAGCRRYVAEGARFRCQAAALAGIETVEAYCEWAAAIGNVTAPGARYELHAAGWDEEHRTALFFAPTTPGTPARAARSRRPARTPTPTTSTRSRWTRATGWPA